MLENILMQMPSRLDLETLSDEALLELRSLVQSVAFLRFRDNVGSPREDAAYKLIAALAVGEHVTIPGKLHNATRKMACARLCNSSATWRGESTNHGTRVTRTR